MKLFVMAGENLAISSSEIEALTGSDVSVDGKFALSMTKMKLGYRLAYCHEIYKVLFRCRPDELIEVANKFEYQKYYKEDFLIKVIGGNHHAKDFAKIVWHKLKEPKVKLINPKTTFTFITGENYAYGCLLNEIIDKSINNRRPHLRPKYMPISLHPKLARCLINLTGIRKGKILDPFCGTGGILIEAGLMGLLPYGIDIDQRMIKITEESLRHFGIGRYNLETGDATNDFGKWDYIVTDLPYGKNTRNQDFIRLYTSFLQRLEKCLRRRAVVVFPDNISYKDLISKNKLKIIHEFDYYIHKSMTKKITVLVRS